MRRDINPLRRAAGGIGQALIVAGLLVLVGPLAWHAYTNVAASDRAEAALADWNVPPSPGERESGTPGESGDFVLDIPRLGLRRVVPEGADRGTLRKFGVGRIPWTSRPGGEGTVGIAGHRTTSGAPFFHLDRLQPGDHIRAVTGRRTYTYAVKRTERVKPAQAHLLQAGPGIRRLVLVTCEPRYSARYRLLVVAVPVADAEE